MPSKIRKFASQLVSRIPVLSTLRKNRRYRTELALLQGRHHTDNQHPSILHFSFNKAATQYTKHVLEQCAIETGMQPVQLHRYAFNSDFPFLDHLSAAEMQQYSHVFKPRGYLYSCFGGMVEGIPEFDKYKVVLMARDPRDILVSQYYSVAFIHPDPDHSGNKFERFKNKREHARVVTIDEYVDSESDAVLNAFLRYKTLMLDPHPDICLLTYEQMIDDFEGWLQKLLDGCELKISTALYDRLVSQYQQSRPVKEDLTRHIRKGIAGDHLNKLKPETIRLLDDKFAPVLQAYGYE